jgi:hypothetical protein
VCVCDISPFFFFAHTHSLRLSILYVHEFSWNEHGFALMERFYPNMAPQYDEVCVCVCVCVCVFEYTCFSLFTHPHHSPPRLFTHANTYPHTYTHIHIHTHAHTQECRTIQELTYNTYFGADDVDTSPLRQAVWYYVLRLYGIQHDDFRYEKINAFLYGPALKRYIEKVACYPSKVTKSDFEALSKFKFDYSERAHITLLAFEAHRQASMLYGLRAIYKASLSSP